MENKNGTLEIRKTLRPNHSKLYLFENKDEYLQGGEFLGTLITGSSNLSRSGLRDQHEINVIFRDEHFKEGFELFNRLWEEAVLIVNKDNFNEFEEKVILLSVTPFNNRPQDIFALIRLFQIKAKSTKSQANSQPNFF